MPPSLFCGLSRYLVAATDEAPAAGPVAAAAVGHAVGVHAVGVGRLVLVAVVLHRGERRVVAGRGLSAGPGRDTGAASAACGLALV